MTPKEFPYTDWMTLKEWKQFKQNYENEEGAINIKEFLLNIVSLNIRFETMIAAAFTWGDTAQGGKYWYTISNRAGIQESCKKCGNKVDN